MQSRYWSQEWQNADTFEADIIDEADTFRHMKWLLPRPLGTRARPLASRPTELERTRYGATQLAAAPVFSDMGPYPERVADRTVVTPRVR